MLTCVFRTRLDAVRSESFEYVCDPRERDSPAQEQRPRAGRLTPFKPHHPAVVNSLGGRDRPGRDELPGRRELMIKLKRPTVRVRLK